MNTELTQLVYNIAYYYAIFCLVTSICIVYLNIRIFNIVKPPLNAYGKFVYFSVTALGAAVFAPVFFLVFIFYSKAYMANAVNIISNFVERQKDIR